MGTTGQAGALPAWYVQALPPASSAADKKHIWGAADICASSLRLCVCVGVIQDGSFLRLPVPPAAG